MIWCTNFPRAHIYTSRKRLSFIWRCTFPVSIPKDKIFLRKVSILDIIITNEPSNIERNVLYSAVTNKFPVNQFSWLRFSLQVKLVISAKVSLSIKERAFKTWYYRKKLCSKPIRKLFWTSWIQLFWINHYLVRQSLLQTGAGISKQGQLYYKTGQVLQSGARSITM